MGKPVFLTGYMASGKTTIGKKLARLLNYEFIDTDELIESMAGKSVQQIFESEGEDSFRQLEHSVIVSLTHRINTVISTGGGTPCYFDNMQRMNKSGITVYIRMAPQSIIKRLKSAKEPRPLIKRIPESELPDFINRHLQQRSEFYEMARLQTKGESIDIEELARSIKNLNF